MAEFPFSKSPRFEEMGRRIERLNYRHQRTARKRMVIRRSPLPNAACRAARRPNCRIHALPPRLLWAPASKKRRAWATALKTGQPNQKVSGIRELFRHFSEWVPRR